MLIQPIDYFLVAWFAVATSASLLANFGFLRKPRASLRLRWPAMLLN
jgi:hypothetical protein